MPLGPGKYDDICSYVYEKAEVDGPGGVVVIVFGGSKGHGFSVQADARTTLGLPDILENIARQIRADTAGN